MLEYDVSKEKGSHRYYVHPVGEPKARMTGLYDKKKKALRIAANLNDLSYKDYMKIRRKELKK